jgi:hypothetical protein
MTLEVINDTYRVVNYTVGRNLLAFVINDHYVFKVQAPVCVAAVKVDEASSAVGQYGKCK